MAQKFHVKRGDVVVVISGSHKGKSGKILEMLRSKQRLSVCVTPSMPIMSFVALKSWGRAFQENWFNRARSASFCRSFQS